MLKKWEQICPHKYYIYPLELIINIITLFYDLYIDSNKYI